MKSIARIQARLKFQKKLKEKQQMEKKLKESQKQP